MANPIRRLVQLILDRASAKKTEADAKEAIGGVEGALGSLKKAAKSIGLAIAAAFSINKIREFLTASIRAAAAAETRYSALAATVEATGQSFEDLKADVDASAAAFEAATIHDDDAYVEGLNRMIALTGDVGASMNNMGLAADVAATFFNGELGPAVDLVAKAMNGNTIALGKMGIQAKTAQQALEILAQRSLGAAEARAATTAGRVAQLGNAWENMKEELGRAMLEGDGAATVLNALSAAVQMLRRWVDENRGAIATWVTRGVDFAIASVDVLYRAVRGLSSILGGVFLVNVGRAAQGIGILVSAYAAAVKGAAALAFATGAEGLGATLFMHAEEAKASAESIREWADAISLLGSEEVRKGLDVLSTPAFTPGQFRPRNMPGGTAPSVATDRPQVSRNAPAGAEPELTATEKALQSFLDTMDQGRILSALLGDDFDALKHEASALETALTALAAEGVDENDATMQALADRLREVRKEMKLLEDATKLEDEAMKAQAETAGVLASALGAAMEGGLGPFAKQKAKQNLLEAAELSIRATMAALTGFGAAKAGAFAAAAGRHLAIAAAWGSLGAGVGGGPSGGGMSPSGARATTAATTERTQPIGNDLTIVFRGAGFHALNPEVQRVVQGATLEGAGRQGKVRVRTVREPV